MIAGRSGVTQVPSGGRSSVPTAVPASKHPVRPSGGIRGGWQVGDVEQRVRAYYDVAGPAYEALMGPFWHHGDLASEEAGHSPAEAARALEERLVADSGLTAG